MLKKRKQQDTYPKGYIESIVALAIYKLYGIHATPRVIQQTKYQNTGELEFIDYTLIVYEIATALGKNPNQIANEITGILPSLLPPAMRSVFAAKAAAGYVNFRIDDAALVNAGRSTIDWLRSPEVHPKQRVFTYMFALGSHFHPEGTISGYEVQLDLFHDLYELLQLPHHAAILLQDASELSVRRHAANLRHGKGAASNDEALLTLETSLEENPQIAREIRKVRMAIGGVSGDTELDDILLAQHGAFVEKWNQIRFDRQLDASSVVSQRTVADKVQKWLDKKSLAKRKSHYFADSDSKAVYFERGDVLAPLRSASGTLLDDAYLLYTAECIVDALVDQRKTADATSILAFVSPKDQLAIEAALADALERAKIDDLRCIVKEAGVTYEEYVAYASELSPHEVFAKVAAAIDYGLTSNVLQDPLIRARLLSLIDLAPEIRQLIDDNEPRRLLPLFRSVITLTEQIYAQPEI